MHAEDGAIIERENGKRNGAMGGTRNTRREGGRETDLGARQRPLHCQCILFRCPDIRPSVLAAEHAMDASRDGTEGGRGRDTRPNQPEGTTLGRGGLVLVLRSPHRQSLADC